MSAFKNTGKYDAHIHEFEGRATADKTFNNFRPFIINEYAKHNKQGKSTAKSIGFRIANAAITMEQVDKEAIAAEHAAETAWAVAEVANALQQSQEKQMDKLMEILTKVMEKDGSMSQNNQATQATTLATRTGNSGTGITTIQLDHPASTAIWYTNRLKMTVGS